MKLQFLFNLCLILDTFCVHAVNSSKCKRKVYLSFFLDPQKPKFIIKGSQKGLKAGFSFFPRISPSKDTSVESWAVHCSCKLVPQKFHLFILFYPCFIIQVFGGIMMWSRRYSYSNFPLNSRIHPSNYEPRCVWQSNHVQLPTYWFTIWRRNLLQHFAFFKRCRKWGKRRQAPLFVL